MEKTNVKSGYIQNADISKTGVHFDKTKSGNLKLSSKRDLCSLHYYIEPKMLFDTRIVDTIINSVKQMIRTSQWYKAYIDYLRNVIGLQFDAFNGNITQDNATLVMHHGPIFSITDYIKIILNWQLSQGMLTNSFLIAHQVMTEHSLNNVQVVMLSKNNHALVHAGKLYLDMRQCWGNIIVFIEKYKEQIKGSPYLMNRIYNYKELLLSPAFKSTDIINPKEILDFSKDEYQTWI